MLSIKKRERRRWRMKYLPSTLDYKINIGNI